MADMIDRQTAQQLFAKALTFKEKVGKLTWTTAEMKQYIVEFIEDLPPAQSDIKDEEAIAHLQSTGWMQNHDKEMYEMGMRKRLSDDSDSYDSMILAAQQWTPYSEELSDENCCTGKGVQYSNWVIATIVNHEDDDMCTTDTAYTVDGKWKLTHESNGYNSVPYYCDVVAWMPLPEPYEGDNNG